MKYFLLPVLTVILASSAFAKEVPIKVKATTDAKCDPVYNNESSISIDMYEKANSYLAAQQKFNGKTKQFEKLAKESDIKKLQLRNSHINVSPGNDDEGNKVYMVSGSVSYTASDDEDKLFVFMDKLEKEKIKARYSNNKTLSRAPKCDVDDNSNYE